MKTIGLLRTQKLKREREKEKKNKEEKDKKKIPTACNRVDYSIEVMHIPSYAGIRSDLHVT